MIARWGFFRRARVVPAALLVALLLAPLAGHAFAADPLIGTRVYFKDDAVAKVGNTVVDKYKVVTFPATVEDVNGNWLWLGRAWVRKQDVMDLPTAFDYYVEAVRRDPRSAQNWQCRASCWIEKGEYANAIKDYDEAIRLDPKRASAYNNRGNAKSDSGDKAGAIKDYDEAIRLDPKNSTAYNGRGNAKSASGDKTGAIRDYDEAIRLDPKFSAAYGGRGWVHHKHGDYAAAIKDYDEALRLDPKRPNSKNNLAFLYATCPDESQRDANKALRLAEEVLAADSKNAYAMNAKACALALSGDFDEAIRWQERALENADYAKDESIFGGAMARERIAAWKKKELWFTTPVK